MKKILIVEDNNSFSELLKAFIEYTDDSIEVTSVDSAERALALFEPKKYDLIISDIALLAMNGLEMCLKIRELDKDVKMIAITGYNELLNGYDMTVAGFDACFSKPDGYKNLMIFVEKFLR